LILWQGGGHTLIHTDTIPNIRYVYLFLSIDFCYYCYNYLMNTELTS